MKKTRFLTLFLNTRNEHLTKDIGAIPYYLYKEYGFDSSIATYMNEKEYSNLDKEVKGVQLLFVKKTFWGELFDGISFLLDNSKEIDVLNLYHTSIKSTVWAMVYKFLNKRGMIYLKTDASYSSVEKLKRCLLRRLFVKRLMSISDIVSVESTPIINEIYEVIKKEYLLLPNGYFETDAQDECLNKEKIVLFIGRVDAPEKNVDLLIDAFINAKLDSDWKLCLTGPYDEEFYQMLVRKCKNSNYNLGENILLLGAIYDRNELRKLYSKASIFVLPSEYESYGIVLVEALSRGCYLIGSNNIPSFDEISDYEKYGFAIDVHSEDAFTDALEYAAEHHLADIDRIIKQIHFSEKRYSWSNIVDKLYTEIQNKLIEM